MASKSTSATSAVVYTIEVRGRAYRYATIEAAKEVAAEIHRRTGVFVGIRAEPAKH